MTTELKLRIGKAVLEWINNDENPDRTQMKLENLSGVSTRYIIEIKQGRDYTMNADRKVPIKEQHYYKLAEAIGFPIQQEIHFNSDNFKKVQAACRFTQDRKRRMLIDSHESGLGKTYGLEYYARMTAKVMYIKVTSMMRGRDLIKELMHKLTLQPIKGQSQRDMLHMITNRIMHMQYLIILDEVESCSPDLYRVIKDLEDATYRKCGLVLSGLGVIDELERGAKRGKRLMPQLWRRFRANQTRLEYVRPQDIEKACRENNITDMGAIKVLQEIIDDYATLSEYIYDIYDWIIKPGKELNAASVRELFTKQQAA